MNKAPCQGCMRRHQACWDSCEEYQEFKRKRRETNLRRGEESSKEQIRYDTMRRVGYRKRK